MKSINLYWVVSISVFLLSVTACQKDAEDVIRAEVEHTEVADDDATVLGERVQNPYSLSVVLEAYDSLVAHDELSARSATNELAPTHLYVKFIPKNEDELAVLRQDTTMAYFDVPLDYEIEYAGHGYRDPAVPDGQPTYLYTSVPIDYVFAAEVEYDILDELFMPDDEEDDENLDERLSSKDYGKLENTADRIAGIELGSGDGQLRSRASKWRPAGRIRVLDDDGTFVPIDGAKVKMRRLTKWKKDISDANGRFSSPNRFRYDVNYSIDWQRSNFTIRDGFISEAKFNGPKRRGDWNLDIGSPYSTQWRYAHIFRGAMRYYYGDILGLTRPPGNGVFKTQMKIRVLSEEGDNPLGNHSVRRRYIPGDSQIKIYGFPANRFASAHYATTVHELAHATHWNMDRNTYSSVDRILRESWARGVQTELTRLEYPGYTPVYFTNFTGVMTDLIDGIGRTADGRRSTVDRVSGYTPSQIEDALVSSQPATSSGALNWTQWRTRLASQNRGNSTSSQLSRIFEYWEGI